MESVSGTIESISRAYNGGWRFASVSKVGTVVGNLPSDLQPGDYCTFHGVFSEHPRYGRQFKADHVQKEIPKDIQGIRNYLDRYKHVGPTIGMEMIRKFGDRVFEVMETNPRALVEVKGISPERAKAIHDEYLSVKEDREHDVFFATHGITLSMQARLVEQYETKQAARREIENNPYKLADEVWGIGFKRADQIALSMGIKKDSRRRLRAGVVWSLNDAEGEGHCYLPLDDLILRVREVTEAPWERIEGIVTELIEAKHLVRCGEDCVYSHDLYQAERQVASILRNLAASHHQTMMNELSRAELDQMDPDQKKGLRYALSSKVLIITGGPGVGKTWLINQILRAIGKRDVALAAPTGKAAKRMFEATGRVAKTIHRLLEYSPTHGCFQKNAHNPLDCETLIIDETSMLDIRLMRHLLDAVTMEQQVIFVGDVDQLPSVGPGRVLGDMIDSGVLPVVRLRTLHRQAEHSYINLNARSINRGDPISLPGKDGDFFFVQEEERDRMAERLVEVCVKFSGYYGFSLNDIQLLCPQRKGPVGSVELNKALRPVLNPKGEKIEGSSYLTGDRVIQTRNNYDLDVFNGDIGVVEGWDQEADKLCVIFEDQDGPRRVFYPSDKIEDLQLAYALSIHKSQGSEFPVVVIPMHTTNYIMLKRNLLYTGITRARKYVILVGTMKAVNTAIKTVDASKRYTNLRKFLMMDPCFEEK